MPRMEADFEWTDVQASTPIYTKGVYELSIAGVRGSAWPKRDGAGNPTEDLTKVVRLRAKIVGVYDSAGKLKGEQDGRTIKGEPTEDINLWVHSSGGRKMAKGHMMAILGYNSRDAQDETKFNDFLKESKADLSTAVAENESGDGFVMTLGDGWEQLFVGKNVKAHMEPQTREIEGRDPVVQQNFTRLVPVNA